MVLKLVFAGILFGCGPVLLSRSGLNSISAILISASASMVLIILVAILLRDTVSTATPLWWLGIISGIAGTIGTLIFINVVLNSPVANLGQIALIVLVTQVSFYAAHHVWTNGGIDIQTGVGLGAALLATMLLVPK